MASNIFEAERDNVRAVLPQAAIAAASYCQLQGSALHRCMFHEVVYLCDSLFAIRGVVTSGEQWVFFVYERHTDGTGLVRSSEYSLGRNLEGLALVLDLLQDSVRLNSRIMSGARFLTSVIQTRS
jgi:hypothetical protein